MVFIYTQDYKKRARVLRRKQTDAEKLLWSKLRNRQLSGCKFYRQFPIRNYIFDFYCPDKKLGIELDGGQHNKEEQKQYDQLRTSYFRTKRISVVRFWDNEVFQYIGEVLEVILKYLQNPVNSP